MYKDIITFTSGWAVTIKIAVNRIIVTAGCRLLYLHVVAYLEYTCCCRHLY